MSVIPITVFFSLGLVFIFVALFWREHRRRRFASAERDSLLPLADESSRPAAAPAVPTNGPEHGPGPAHPHEHDHSAGRHHGDGGCGCEQPGRPPCADCRRAALPAASPAL